MTSKTFLSDFIFYIMYTIVLFTEENSIQGVPTEWISKLQDGYYCRFPDKNLNPSKLVKKMKSVDLSWPLHPCIIKDTASSYELMLQLENDFLLSTTDCQDSEKSEISDLEEISGDEIIPLPPMAKRKKSFSINDEAKQTFFPKKKCPVANVPFSHTSTVSQKSTGSSRQLSFSASKMSMKNQDNYINNRFDSLEKHISDGFEKLYEKLSSKYEAATNHLNTNICHFKEELKILKKRDINSLLIDSENLPELPIKSIEELNEMEKVLESNDEKVILIHKMMNFAAGSSFRSVVHSIMNNTLTNEVSVLHSLHGKGKLEKRKFLDLNTCYCVQGVIFNQDISIKPIIIVVYEYFVGSCLNVEYFLTLISL